MKKHNAFTMIELIVVLIVLGVIASYSIPRVKRDTRSEAMNHMLNTIRYTQNLALHDSKHQRFDSRWQRAYWRFQVYKCKSGSGLFYMIGTDRSTDPLANLNGKLNRSETAIDPSNGKFTFWNTKKQCPIDSVDALNNQVSPNIFITQRYGINKVVFNNCSIYKNGRTRSSAKHIGFDGFGRPHKSFTASVRPNHWGYAIGVCSITFSFTDTSINPFTIDIDNETGYATVRGNPSL